MEPTQQQLIEALKGTRNRLMDDVKELPTENLFLNGFSAMSDYHDLRDRIHQVQRERGISGLVWKTYQLGDQTLAAPDYEDQLELLEDDFRILHENKDRVIDAVCKFIESNFVYLSIDVPTGHLSTWDGSSSRITTTTDAVRHFQDFTDYAILSQRLSETFPLGEEEYLTLYLGTGNPILAGYKNHPDCEEVRFDVAYCCQCAY